MPTSLQDSKLTADSLREDESHTPKISRSRNVLPPAPKNPAESSAVWRAISSRASRRKSSEGSSSSHKHKILSPIHMKVLSFGKGSERQSIAIKPKFNFAFRNFSRTVRLQRQRSNEEQYRRTLQEVKIKERDLQSMRQQHNQLMTSPLRKALVRHSRPADKPHSPHLVSVYLKAPQNASVLTTPDQPVPRHTPKGSVIAHSLLGTFPEFCVQARQHGERRGSPDVLSRHHYRASSQAVEAVQPRARLMATPRWMVPESRDASSLRQWQSRLEERKRTQAYLSRKLKKDPTQLLMNMGETYNLVRDHHHFSALTRTLQQAGGEEHFGLKRFSEAYRGLERKHSGRHLHRVAAKVRDPQAASERARAVQFAQIGFPEVALTERGQSERRRRFLTRHLCPETRHVDDAPHYKPMMQHLFHHVPEFEGLQVVGTSKAVIRYYEEDSSLDQNYVHEARSYFSTDSSSSWTSLESVSLICTTSSSSHSEESGTVGGPSLLVGGKPARWSGDEVTFLGEVGVECHVQMEVHLGETVRVYLDVVNDGTTVVFYNWVCCERENALKKTPPRFLYSQFTFDTSSGVLLPGEMLHFPVVFRALRLGRCKEQWQLLTRPVLCGGGAILISLGAIVWKEDEFREVRLELERQLWKRQVHQMVRDIITKMVLTIEMPQRRHAIPPPTEQELFKLLNPDLLYNESAISAFRCIYEDMCGDGNAWDFDVTKLKRRIRRLRQTDRKAWLLRVLDNGVQEATRKRPVLGEVSGYIVGMQLLREACDEIQRVSARISSSLKITDPVEPGDGTISIFVAMKLLKLVARMRSRRMTGRSFTRGRRKTIANIPPPNLSKMAKSSAPSEHAGKKDSTKRPGATINITEDKSRLKAPPTGRSRGPSPRGTALGVSFIADMNQRISAVVETLAYQPESLVRPFSFWGLGLSSRKRLRRERFKNQVYAILCQFVNRLEAMLKSLAPYNLESDFRKLVARP